MATKVAKLPTVEDALNELDQRDNLRIWNALGKTDPAHTKGFKRAGGFQGTAIKPIWVTQRLTEQFGPCGAGWGFEQPQFQLVTAGEEVMVYCTVTAWYLDDGKQHFLYGVGGDRVAGKNKYGLYTDDEAFKKAFTDALGNAFKFVGVGADVHMGLFEDSKYLAEVTKEFHPSDGGAATNPREAGDMSDSALRGCIKALVHNLHGCASVADVEELLDMAETKEVIEQCQRRFPNWWSTGKGMPDEFTPLKTIIEQTRAGLAQLEAAE